MEEAEIQSSKMIFAQGNAVRVGGLQTFPAPEPTLLLLNHTWVDSHKWYLQAHVPQTPSLSDYYSLTHYVYRLVFAP